MGSWANNFHVKHEDLKAVAAAIEALLRGKGYEADTGQYQLVAAHKEAAQKGAVDDFEGDAAFSKDEHDDWDDLDDDEQFEKSLEDYDDDKEFDDAEERMAGGGVEAAEPPERRIVVYQPVQGWVGVVDSAGLTDFARELSHKLNADCLQVYVNDSDFWGYEILRAGTALDQFDSSGDPEGLDSGEMPPELAAAVERGDEDAIEREVQKMMLKHAPTGPIVYHDGRVAQPPEMAFLKTRIEEGKASIGDRFRYAWLWIKFQCRRLWGWIFPSSLPFGFDVPPVKPLDADALEKHVAVLKQVFPHADEAGLRALLPQSRFPSELLLVDFLKAVGLPDQYGHLSYDYREDFGEDELAAVGIVQSAELRFVLPPKDRK